MIRKKRIQIEPEGVNAKRKTKTPAERLWLTRRMFLVKGSVVAGFTLLGARLAQLQILEHKDYQEQAADYTLRTKKEKAPRGLIYDRAGRPLAENKRTWEVLVTPARLPEDENELRTVKETLINALQLPEALIVDPSAVPVGSENTVYARIGMLLEPSAEDQDKNKQKWIDFITAQAKINYVVMCEPKLTADEAALFRAASQELPGVEVVSYLDYLLLNSWSGSEVPISVAKNVPREVALKLEANTIHLPGISIDDSAMTRVYPGGPVMAHILGYVSGVTKEELEDPANQTSAGTPLYDPDDSLGKAGLELTQEQLLRGTKGLKVVEVDTNEVVQRVITTQQEIKPGQNLKLTIDLELQAALSKAIADGAKFSNEDRTAKDEAAAAIDPTKKVKKYDCGAGAIVMMDARNGEVLAMVSYPDYDNQLFIQGLSQRKYDQLLDEKAKKPLVSRAMADHNPPGSTLKLFIAATALREKKIDESTTFFCDRAIRVPFTWNEAQGSNYYCWIRTGDTGHGDVNVRQAIAHSCDIFFYNAGAPKQEDENGDYVHYYDMDPNSENLSEKHYFGGVGIEAIHTNLTKRFWFGAPTKIDIPFEAQGLVPNPEWLFDNYSQYWSIGDTINVSIGQGYFLATPLQLALNTAAIANNGTIYRPLLLKGTVDTDQKDLDSFPPEKMREIKINKNHLRVVREGMWDVVNDPVNGTAVQTYVTATGEYISKWPLSNPEGQPKIEIAGKTGTAEFGEQAEDGSYARQHAWFTAFAPYDNPEVAVTVFLEDGGEGSSYAVPITDRAIRAYFEWSGKRDRGTVLRTDKNPISEAFPAPDTTHVEFKPGETQTEAQD
jgi:penicillin-binding protein 2